MCPRPRGRPCRRSTISWARAFSQAATARAPAPSPRRDARSAAVRASVTASWSLHALARGCAHARRLGVCLRWQVPVRSVIQAPSAMLFSLAPSRVRAPCRAHARTTPSGKADAQEDAPMPRRLARKCFQQRGRRSPCARIGRHGMVAAFGKAATATHGRQPGDRAERVPARGLAPASCLYPRRARRHTRASTLRPPFPPPRPSPLDPPTWAPPWRSLAARAR